MLSYRVQAYNTAHDSENKIHDDAVARQYGFTGALVPGVDVYAYMMHLPVARWGREFLERGTAECKFTSPVYDGEMVEVAAREEGEAILIEVTSQGKSCANGSARLGSLPKEFSIEDLPIVAAPVLENRPAANSLSLAPGCVLGTQFFDASREFMAGYLRDIRETDDLYRREGLVHPGNVLRMCNYALFRNVKMGPWIHAGSKVQNLGAERAGEMLSARSRVSANYEKKGHLFVDLDVLVLSNARAVARVLHTAIYQPRQAARAA
jgi:hydrogenase maturation factor